MKLKDYPKEIQDLIVKRLIEQNQDEEPVGLITFHETEEGALFWCKIQEDNLQPFYDKYPVPDTREKK